MIGRLISVELYALRRSPVVWIAALLVAGGSLLARTATWASGVVAGSELGGILGLEAVSDWSAAAVPLSLLAYLIVTSFLFGRDFDDGSVDLLLTAPVRREAVVVARMAVVTAAVLVLALLGWGADAAMHALLATTSFDPGPASSVVAALAAALAALATLPIVAWAAVRFEGVLPALGAGVAVQAVVLGLGDITYVQALPWALPAVFAAGRSASWVAVALSAALFAGGLLASLRVLRAVDLYE